MIRQILLIAVLFISLCVNAQTGIGTTSPDASAKLHVESSNKGFLPPRVALTATNSATPIASPANGLMVFNTETAGTNPFQVVPGYYYWDGTGQQWVSLSTTVGNVQNQAIFRSTSNTTGSQVVSSWNTRFNNIAPGDLTVISNSNFALSNGVYKIQWGLPYQSSQTYNAVQLQENVSGTWGAWRNDAYLAGLANGGGTDWGGTSFMTDYIDCSAGTRTLRLYNPDTRTLFYGASFIITKLNPAITTSTTADNLGDHTATKNVLLSNNYLSNDGGNEGIRIDNAGNVGIGTNAPAAALDVTGNIKASGTIIGAAAGSTVKTTMLSSSDLASGSSTTVNATTFTSIASYSYTPVSNRSYIIIEYYTSYTIGGYGTDAFGSQIAVGGTTISTGLQNYTSSGAGGGTRSSVLFPLVARYTNASTSAISIAVQVKRTSGDDAITANNDNSTWMKITEIAR